uniref:Reverse transcriptase domain-containing protein n=1 Tax=Trichuris muris TaxID=70415 RepID=A0A5S6Q352_TRIMR
MTGMFQGFTGTMDTVLHVHMLYFCTHEAKRKKILKSTEAARAAALIDDAIISVPLDISRTAAEAQHTADVFLYHVRETYLKLGFIIDMGKTNYSTDKCIFLNRVYESKSEVVTSMKIFAKISHEFRRRFVGSDEHVASIFNTRRCATARGADPAVIYYYCCFKSLMYLMARIKREAKWDRNSLVVGSLMPIELEGMAFPTIVNWLTGIQKDPLSAFCAMCSKVHKLNRCNTLGIALVKATARVCLGSTSGASAWSITANPMHMHFSVPAKPAALAREYLRVKLAYFSRSPVFEDVLRTLFNRDFDTSMSLVVDDQGVKGDAEQNGKLTHGSRGFDPISRNHLTRRKSCRDNPLP